MFDVTCAHCGSIQQAPAMVCTQCEHILQFYPMSPFVLFHAQPTFSLDPVHRDQIYFEVQKKLHPDRVFNAPANEQAWAEEFIGQLNDAYKSLRNRLMSAQAAYLYFKDPKTPASAFNDLKLPMPDMAFLGQVMTLQAQFNIDEFQALSANVLKQVDQAIHTKSLTDLLDGIAKLTYIERLHTLKQE